MTIKAAEHGRFSLRRWSQRKLDAARAETQPPPPPPVPVADVGAAARASAGTAPRSFPTSGSAAPPAGAELPAIESLTIDSDFAPFFKPEVDESIKRAALKQLFRDPRFNVMDGLDTYIDDYTQADPIPESMLEELMQRRVFFSPPADQADLPQRAGDELAPDPGAISAVPIAPPSAAAASAPPMMQSPASPPSTNVPPVSAMVPERPIAATTPSGIEATAGAKADEK